MTEDNNITQERTTIGQLPVNGKCRCGRCNKLLAAVNFYSYKDGSKSDICKPCLTAHIDNFDSSTFVWILEKMDVPYIPVEWNVLRDKAFAKDPYNMTGMSVIGKYLAKMKLNQWNKYGFADSKRLLEEMQAEQDKKEQKRQNQKAIYEAELKVQLSEGAISEAEYKTLVSSETQNQELQPLQGDVITGQRDIQKPTLFKPTTKPKKAEPLFIKEPTSYAQAIGQARNPFQEKNFMSQDQFEDLGQKLTKDDKMYLALKWGRLYTPAQWISLQKMYNQFMRSFDIQGAARIDTLKMICKTSLKMNAAIDQQDVDNFNKLSRTYDSLMKSAKFTEAQKKEDDSNTIDSAAALVDFVESHSGQIPRYRCDEPQDIVDRIILDLKEYNKNLIYDDKSLAQEIEKYLKNKSIAEEMKRDREKAIESGQGETRLPLKDQDFVKYKEATNDMKEHDKHISEQSIEQEYNRRKVRPKNEP